MRAESEADFWRYHICIGVMVHDTLSPRAGSSVLQINEFQLLARLLHKNMIQNWLKYLQDSVDFLGEKIRLESVLSQILKEMATVRVSHGVQEAKLDILIQTSKVSTWVFVSPRRNNEENMLYNCLHLQDLLDEMESTRRMVRDNTEYVKRINQIATGASGGSLLNHIPEIAWH